MADDLICPACPQCGCPEYHSVKPVRSIAFTKDRQCKECCTQYRPPTPTWAGVLFVLIGALFVLGCGASIAVAAARGNAASVMTNAVFFVLGGACVSFGVQSFREQSLEAPPYTPGGSSTPDQAETGDIQ